MSLLQNNLPFERGGTFGGASGMTLTSVSIEKLVGATFVVPDDEHETGAEVTLRLVKNDSGSDITFNNQIVRFGTDAKDFGRYVDGTTDQNGMVGLPIDDAYTASYVIKDDDYFYVVQRGPCDVLSAASAFVGIAGEPVTTNSAGALHQKRAGAYDFILGTLDADSSEEETAMLVWVDANLWNPSGSAT